jgi:hypothetical protein
LSSGASRKGQTHERTADGIRLHEDCTAERAFGRCGKAIKKDIHKVEGLVGTALCPGNSRCPVIDCFAIRARKSDENHKNPQKLGDDAKLDGLANVISTFLAVK